VIEFKHSVSDLPLSSVVDAVSQSSKESALVIPGWVKFSDVADPRQIYQ
jgi:hypothetical protein